MGALHVRCTNGPFLVAWGRPEAPKRPTNFLQIGNFYGGGGIRTLGAP